MRPTRMLLNGIVPWTKWKEAEPPVNRLKVMGCQVFIKLSPLPSLTLEREKVSQWDIVRVRR
eukprot:Ihof_evm6s487 gene=Ihof_evmTU6s487